MFTPSYKLENMLSNYEQYLNYQQTLSGQVDKGFFTQKNNLAKMLMNVILIGGENLNNEQVQALYNFHNIFSKKHPTDTLVGLISQVLGFKMEQKIKRQAPDDIRAVVQTFQSVTDFQALSEKTKKAIFYYAINRLQAAKNEYKFFDYDYTHLTQFVKVLTICWDKFYVHLPADTKSAINYCLLDLITDISPSNKASVLEFREIAMTLIKKYESTKIPDDITNHPAYHGEALKEGFSKLEEMLKAFGTTAIPLLDFAKNYCQDHLKANEYLIRNSSTQPSKDSQGTHYYIVTISFKQADGTLWHARITRIETPEGKISWKTGTRETNPNFEKEPSFKTIREFIEATPDLAGFTPSKPPTTEAVIGYVHNRYAHG
jgi:hypothetical protein